MTLSIAPGLESNGTCRATEFTRGGSMPSAAPTERTALACPQADVHTHAQRSQSGEVAIAVRPRLSEATLLHERRNRCFMQR